MAFGSHPVSSLLKIYPIFGRCVLGINFGFSKSPNLGWIELRFPENAHVFFLHVPYGLCIIVFA